MTDLPHARDLLAMARSALLDELLPALPARMHYQARMAANAIAIAAREIELAGVLRQQEWEALMNVLEPAAGTRPQSPRLAPGAIEINRARRKLSNAIRDGLFDHGGQRQQQLIEMLEQIIRGKLAIDNPRALRP